MKRIMFLLLVIYPLCVFAQDREKSIWFPKGEGMASFIIDYRYVTSKGFFITESNSVSFNYAPIGRIEMYAERYFSEIKKGDPDYEKYGALSENDYNAVKNGHPIKVYDFPSIYKIFDQIMADGKTMGANGVINFKIDYKYNSSSPLPSQIFVSGMYIKK